MCQRKKSKKKKMIKHLEQVHGPESFKSFSLDMLPIGGIEEKQQNPKRKEEVSGKRVAKPFQCSICDSTRSTINKMKKHLVMKHQRDGFYNTQEVKNGWKVVGDVQGNPLSKAGGDELEASVKKEKKKKRSKTVEKKEELEEQIEKKGKNKKKKDKGNLKKDAVRDGSPEIPLQPKIRMKMSDLESGVKMSELGSWIKMGDLKSPDEDEESLHLYLSSDND